MADEDGNLELNYIPDGEQTIVFSYIGYEEKNVRYIFPRDTDKPVIILLESSHEELEEVFVSSTRGRRTIENIPTRIEFIVGEEMEE